MGGWTASSAQHRTCVTVNYAFHFLRPAMGTSRKIRCRAAPVKLGRTLCVYHVVLLDAADTVVALEGAVLGKPASPEEAARMLAALSGRTHQVYTGLTLAGPGAVCTEHEVTDVTFRALSGAEIAAYVATGEPMDKAGAYGIQGLGGLLVAGIQGDYHNVVGLPVCRLGRMLLDFGVDCLALAGR